MIQALAVIIKNHTNEFGRKFLHIATVIFCLGLVSIFNPGGVAFIIACVTILVFLADTLNFLDFFKNVRRVSYGHYYMALGIILTLTLYSIFKNYPALVFAFLVLGICDPLAEFGRPVYCYLVKLTQFKWLRGLTFRGKTITGSLIFFVSSLALSLIILVATGVNIQIGMVLRLLISIALLTAIEFWSVWGIDNLTLPLGAFALYQFVMPPS